MLFSQTKTIFSLSHITLLGLIMVSIVALFGFYVFQLNEMAQDRYLVENCKQKINEIISANKNLEINFTQTNSLQSIETLVQNLNFETIDEIHYIRILEPAMAAR